MTMTPGRRGASARGLKTIFHFSYHFSRSLRRSLPLALIPRRGAGRSVRVWAHRIRGAARRNPICKYFSHLKAEINDSRGKSVGLLVAISPRRRLPI